MDVDLNGLLDVTTVVVGPVWAGGGETTLSPTDEYDMLPMLTISVSINPNWLRYQVSSDEQQPLRERAEEEIEAFLMIELRKERDRVNAIAMAASVDEELADSLSMPDMPNAPKQGPSYLKPTEEELSEMRSERPMPTPPLSPSEAADRQAADRRFREVRSQKADVTISEEMGERSRATGDTLADEIQEQIAREA